jgi:hypothetical protein
LEIEHDGKANDFPLRFLFADVILFFLFAPLLLSVLAKMSFLQGDEMMR